MMSYDARFIIRSGISICEDIINNRETSRNLGKLSMAIMATRRLPKMNFYSLLLISIMLIGIFLSSAMSLLNSSLNIRSSGTVAVPAVTVNSEIRGVFVHAASLANPNWTTIANTLSTYGINTVAIEVLGNDWAHYPSLFIPWMNSNMSWAVSAFHAKGIQVYVDMNVLLGAYTGDGKDRRSWAVPYGGNISNIGPYNWLSPANPDSQTLLKNLVQEVVSNFSFDGFMFDYIRFDSRDMPYDPASKTRFIADTGLSDVNWPTDVVSTEKGGTGKYFSRFLEWKCDLITSLVADMRSWMLAINPNLKFAAAPWNFGSLNPIYWRYWLGQDAAHWIALGYLDWVSPQMYGNDTAGFVSSMTGWKQWATGGAHGKVGLVPFITDLADYTRTTADVARYVSTLRANGADGWMISRFGGPGDGTGDSVSPDIAPYLAAIGLPDPTTFTLSGIATQTINDTSIQVSWTTSSATTSRVEYNSSALYTASLLPYSGFDYWQITHVAGTIVTSNLNVTSHTVVLNGLSLGITYYFQVQSQDQSGTATSKVLTFNTG